MFGKQLFLEAGVSSLGYTTVTRLRVPTPTVIRVPLCLIDIGWDIDIG